ncbi:MAG: AzlD domain-containing protein [Congregibacter sp.]
MSALLAILLVGLGTYASRAVFILALAQRQFPPLALRALEYVAPAVMGALVVSMLTSAEGTVAVGFAEIAGLGCCALLAWKTRNHVYALFAAMTAYWLLAAMLN